MNREQLKIELKLDEGVRLKPYTDTKGKVTIGVGRNLDDLGISEDEAMMMLDNDIDRVSLELNRSLPWWVELSDARQRVMVNMGFMGVPKLLGFRKMISAMRTLRYDVAADEMKDSKWYKDVGARADRLIEMMRNG